MSCLQVCWCLVLHQLYLLGSSRVVEILVFHFRLVPVSNDGIGECGVHSWEIVIRHEQLPIASVGWGLAPGIEAWPWS